MSPQFVFKGHSSSFLSMKLTILLVSYNQRLHSFRGNHLSYPFCIFSMLMSCHLLCRVKLFIYSFDFIKHFNKAIPPSEHENKLWYVKWNRHRLGDLRSYHSVVYFNNEGQLSYQNFGWMPSIYYLILPLLLNLKEVSSLSLYKIIFNTLERFKIANSNLYDIQICGKRDILCFKNTI